VTCTGSTQEHLKIMSSETSRSPDPIRYEDLYLCVERIKELCALMNNVDQPLNKGAIANAILETAESIRTSCTLEHMNTMGLRQ
jgi:hypothetical protein